ncbi:tRNA lysidine(34) synthetase TilS [Aerolutibacter ruishenii]|nr:tRNA lysidine(34) synthetase TilS [Lysobacter ruishenii]
MPAPTAPLPAPTFRDLPAAPLCVGYSGGLDSTVLLHALAALPGVRASGLRALHVHHGLHADADQWTAHCVEVCAALDVPLLVDRVQVPAASGEGPEAAARHARRAAYARHLGRGEVLVLAHHQDDQAETFLLRALRGSGPDGLAAMRRWSALGDHRIWRPLLATPRHALLAHAHTRGLHWLEDPSNADTAFDRNFLRNRVMPLLRDRWPAAGAAFAQAAGHCEDATALLHDEDERHLAEAATADPATLSRTVLRGLPPTRRARVLRLWIASLGLPPLPAEGVAQIEHEVLPARADARAMFAWEGAAVRSWRDLLHAAPLSPPPPAGWHTLWAGDAPLAIPGGGSLHLEGAAQFPQPAIVGLRDGGERITLPGRTHSHALKHVLQDLGVPPWEREHLPVLRSAEGDVLAAGDLTYSSVFDAWLRQHGARLHWRPPTGTPRD